MQTLEVDAVNPTLFSDNRAFLKTNMGALHTTFFSDRTALSRLDLPPFTFVKDQWASQGAETILWLPSEHRPSSVAVHGSTNRSVLT